MSSKNVILSGKAYWARVYEGNHDEYNGREFYKITVALDDASWAKYNKSGMSLKARPVSSQDEDAPLGITFKRDLEAKVFTDKKTGKTKELGGGAPRVKDADGQVMDALIGNGSDVEVLVNVYKTKTVPVKTGHRLEAVKVVNLIPYDEFREDDLDEEDEPVKEEVKTETKATTKRSNKDLPF